jgi:hypothetical protein
VRGLMIACGQRMGHGLWNGACLQQIQCSESFLSTSRHGVGGGFVWEGLACY